MTATNLPNAAGAAIVREGADLIQKDRAATHGDARRNYEAVAALWTAFLSARWGLAYTKLTAGEVVTMLELMKIGRRATAPFNADNYRDTAGYTGLAYELEKPLYEQGPPIPWKTMDLEAAIDAATKRLFGEGTPGGETKDGLAGLVGIDRTAHKFWRNRKCRKSTSATSTTTPATSGGTRATSGKGSRKRSRPTRRRSPAATRKPRTA